MSTTKFKTFWKLPLALDETQRILCLISLGYPFVGSGLTPHPALSFLSTYNIIGQGCVNIAMMLTQPWPLVIYFQPGESCYGSRYRCVLILCVLYTVYYCNQLNNKRINYYLISGNRKHNYPKQGPAAANLNSRIYLFKKKLCKVSYFH